MFEVRRRVGLRSEACRYWYSREFTVSDRRRAWIIWSYSSALFLLPWDEMTDGDFKAAVPALVVMEEVVKKDMKRKRKDKRKREEEVPDLLWK